jgi:hypothetical protein
MIASPDSEARAALQSISPTIPPRSATTLTFCFIIDEWYVAEQLNIRISHPADAHFEGFPRVSPRVGDTLHRAVP